MMDDGHRDHIRCATNDSHDRDQHRHNSWIHISKPIHWDDLLDTVEAKVYPIRKSVVMFHVEQSKMGNK
jgi:hypothetical protein